MEERKGSCSAGEAAGETDYTHSLFSHLKAVEPKGEKKWNHLLGWLRTTTLGLACLDDWLDYYNDSLSPIIFAHLLALSSLLISLFSHFLSRCLLCLVLPWSCSFLSCFNLLVWIFNQFALVDCLLSAASTYTNLNLVVTLLDPLLLRRFEQKSLQGNYYLYLWLLSNQAHFAVIACQWMRSFFVALIVQSLFIIASNLILALFNAFIFFLSASSHFN